MSVSPALVVAVIQIALQLAMALLTPKPKIFGPRLEDKQITSSAYGEAIPLNYGTMRLHGNVIWGTDLEEVVKKSSLGKGGGSQFDYLYFANFAVAFCEGEQADVIQIYADGNLIYDATATQTDQLRMEGLTFRFYGGSETQAADPLIVDKMGVDDAPAYRDTCYIVFDALPVQNFGNRIPQIEAVIASKASSLAPVATAFDDVGTGLDRRYAYDAERNLIYVFDHSSDINTNGVAMSVYDASTGTRLQEFDMEPDLEAAGINTATLAGIFGPSALIGANGPYLAFWADDLVSGGRTPIALYDKDSLALLDLFGERDTASTTTANGITETYGFPTGRAGTAFQTVTSLGFSAWWLAVGSHGLQTLDNGKLGVAILNIFDGQFQYIWGEGVNFGGATVAVVQGQQRPGETDVLFVNREATDYNTTDNNVLRRVTVNHNAGYSKTTDTSFGVDVEVVYTFTGATDSPPRIVYHAPDNSLFFDDGSEVGKIDIATGTLLWSATSSETGLNGPADNGSHQTDGRAWLGPGASGEFNVYDGDSGEVIETIPITGVTFSNGVNTYTYGASIIDATNRRVWLRDDGAWVSGDRLTGAPEDLADVVSDLSTRGRLTASDIDVTDLAGIDVNGFFISRQTNPRRSLEPLGAAFNFDGAEVGGQIVYTLRGNATDITLAETDLVRNGEDPWIEETRGIDLDVPAAITINYVDPSDSWQVASQTSRRIQSPVATMQSTGETAIDMPLSMTAAQAQEAAERLLYQAWTERQTIKFSTSQEFLEMVPNDVLAVTADDATFNVRAIEVAVGADMSIEVSAAAQETFVYTPAQDAVTPPGSNITTDINTTPPVLVEFVLDMPLIRDTDSTGRQAAVIYTAASRAIASAGGYQQSAIWVNNGGDGYQSTTQHTNEADWGVTTTALADIPSFEWNSVQEVSLTVRMIRGTISSVTEFNMISGLQNHAALVKGNGEVEIIAFRDVTDNGDGTHTVTGLLRGQRGTEVFATGHATGQRFVMLNTDDVRKYEVGTDRLGGAYAAVALSGRQQPEDTSGINGIYQHRSLRPYAVVQVTRTDGGGDITLSWERRTRVSGELVDGIDTVPLSEDVESYEIDILSGDGGSVLRTLTSSTDSVTYFSEQITDDLGTAPTTLYCKIYQMSAQVGRGFAVQQAVEAA